MQHLSALRRAGPLAAVVLAASALTAFAATPTRAAVAVPPVARVSDLTGTLSAQQRTALDAKLAAFEARKGSQIAVLVVPTTEPEDIAQFGIRIADAWRLGRKSVDGKRVDDGLILIVAKDDRRVRIEVGTGLEGAVTDLASNRVIDEFLRPHFRAGDFYGGIDSAVDRLIGLVDGEPLPAPQQRQLQQRQQRSGGFQTILPILLVFGLVAGSLLRRVLGRPLGALATGGIAAFAAHVLLGVLGVSIFAGLVGFVLTMLGGLGNSGFGAGRGGFGGGLGGLGGFGGLGGGGLGGGGFSGGGGGFSGGGASGSW